MTINAWNNTSHRFKAQIIGKLLGDAGIKIQPNRKPRLQFNHVASDYEWSLYCYENLKSELPLNPPYFYKQIDPRIEKGYSLLYYVQSRTDDIICYLEKEWYHNQTKVLPFDSVEKHFTVETLAWWYMDDGHLKIENHIPRKIILSTENFTDDEIEFLIEFLQTKYKLPFAIDGQRRIAIYKQSDIHYFFELISPHTHISMQRKLKQVSFINNNQLEAKRTTIYLPSTINLDRPTVQINRALRNLDYLIHLYKQNKIHKYFIDIPIAEGKRKSYQIVINQENINKLNFLKLNSGVTYSNLAEQCFKNKYI